MLETIRITNARLNNLKNISLEIPRNKLVVVTGLSGSGKSTLVFDTLFQESQRLFLGAQGAVSEGLQKPAVDSIEGLSPAIAIGQHQINRNPRSTVGTASDVYTYLRILYSRIGHRPCPACGQDVPPATEPEEDVLEQSDEEYDEQDASSDVSCPTCAQHLPPLSMSLFSFNVPAGACPTCTGIGNAHEPDLKRIFDLQRSIQDGGVRIWNKGQVQHYIKLIKYAERHFGFTFDVSCPLREMGEIPQTFLFYGPHSQQFRRHFPHVAPPTREDQGNMEGVIPNILRRYQQHANDDKKEDLEQYLSYTVCPTCQGGRLQARSQEVHIQGMPITTIARWPLTHLVDWLSALPAQLPEHERQLGDPLFQEALERTLHLIEVGVGYLTLHRDMPSLSGGETQRVRLASLLGSGLTGVLYILDEPTTGLHPRDTARLIQALHKLRDLGNTVLVVEHDLDVIRMADYLVELGPGAGTQGGQIVARGTFAEFITQGQSVTGSYLSGAVTLPTSDRRHKPVEHFLTIRGAREHNLKNITVEIPLERLVVISGVSGSGKSSLVLDVLGRAATHYFTHAHTLPGEHDTIGGLQRVSKVVVIDQDPLGRHPRSSPATYCGIYTPLRTFYAQQAAARARGLSSRDFSFNVPGGRCERCEGAGVLSISMYFLPPATVRCPACQGRRFKRHVLEVTYAGHDIARVLTSTIEEVLRLFQDIPTIATPLSLLVDVGLGYLQLGQPVTTLSGGEAQRIKLANELAHRSKNRCLYILDEPTAGLHVDDSARLLRILHRLVDAGNTILVIEHDLEVIAAADWIIDLGLEGGQAGGEVMAQGTPEEILSVECSHTARFLRQRAALASAR